MVQMTSDPFFFLPALPSDRCCWKDGMSMPRAVLMSTQGQTLDAAPARTSPSAPLSVTPPIGRDRVQRAWSKQPSVAHRAARPFLPLSFFISPVSRGKSIIFLVYQLVLPASFLVSSRFAAQRPRPPPDHSALACAPPQVQDLRGIQPPLLIYTSRRKTG
ncbi:hypothetical protein VTN02DRAFT_6872 [Thermoascus thermophilus]